MLLLGCSRATAGSAQCDDRDRFDGLIAVEIEHHPGLASSDLLKLLQQATLGAEHAVPDAAAAQAWMRQEWSTLGSGPAVSLVEPLGRAGDYVRINLRPWRDQGGDPDTLTARFIATARSVVDTSRLECALGRLVALAATNQIPFDADQIAADATAWRAQGFPAMHHSAEYERRYRPAYRVIARSAVPGLLATLPDPGDATTPTAPN